MPITQDNIKLRKSERLTDFDDGGGAMTGVDVVSGQLNNVFPDVSRLDKTYGRVSLRKVFLAVDTATTETLFGAHAIITDPPEDTDIDVTMFQTGVYADQRIDAKNRLESYVVPSIESRYVLFGLQVSGQQNITVYCDTDVGDPEIGQVLCLRQYNQSNAEALGAVLLNEQFIRIQRLINRQNQDFIEPGTGANPVKFVKSVITVELSNSLRSNFSGAQPTLNSGSPATAKVNLTSAADAATYFGIKKLSANASAGSLTVNVTSLFAQLVPSAQTEIPIVDARAGGETPQLLRAADVEIVSPLTSNTIQQTPTAITPGTCRTADGGVFDDGEGNLVGGGNTLKIDYAAGRIQYLAGTNSLPDFRYVPAAALPRAAFTGSYPVTLSTRSFNFVLSLKPVPSPGSFYVDFKSQGRWYRLRDKGAGVLRGDDASFGSGSVSYTTGTVVVTCGALPDVNTALLYGWGSAQEYTARTAATLQPIQVPISLPDANIEPGSVTLQIPNTATTQVAATVAAGGTITGAGVTGYLDHQLGKGYVVLTFLPPQNSAIAAAYGTGNAPPQAQTFTGLTPDANGDATVTLGAASIKSGSVSITLQQLQNQVGASQSYFGFSYAPAASSRAVKFTDNGSGVLINEQGLPVGTVNYTTRIAVVKLQQLSTRPVPPYSFPQVVYSGSAGLSGGGGSGASIAYAAPAAVTPRTWSADGLQATWALGSAAYTNKTASVPIGSVTINVLPDTTESLVGSTVVIDFASKRFYDNGGVIYRDFNPATGSGVVAGSISYQTGVVTLNSYGPGGSAVSAPVLRSALTVSGAVSAANIIRFRTSGSPLRPSSLVAQATRIEDGVAVTVTSDSSGNLSGANASGTVDFENGIVYLQFGQVLDDNDSASNLTHRTQLWYAPTARYNIGTVAVPNWRVLRPTPVDPGSVRYSAISFAALPLDANLIGVDAVRLPSDGRVPVFKKGYVLVVHDTVTTTLPNNLTSSQVINLPRSGLAYVNLLDQAGVNVPSAQYSVNLATGVVTMAPALNLSGLLQPIRAEHRIEDMVLCTDSQISGQLSLSRALVNNYTAANSYVSSALLFGDLQARQTALFDQQTWTNVWQNTVIGSSAPASYNSLAFPIEMRNDGAITERWALVFTSATAYNIVGETTGVVGAGTISADAAPLNPLNNQPYFRVRAGGFGAGWAAGNVIRFNTTGAIGPTWTARTTKPGVLSTPTDSVRLQLRGDAN